MCRVIPAVLKNFGFDVPKEQIRCQSLIPEFLAVERLLERELYFGGSVRETELSEDSGILRAIFTEGFLPEAAGYVWSNISRLGVSGSI